MSTQDTRGSTVTMIAQDAKGNTALDGNKALIRRVFEEVIPAGERLPCATS